MANRYWVGGSGTWDASSTANWSTTSGGAAGASAPTSVDAVFIDANSGAGTITTAAGAVCAAATFDAAAITLLLGDAVSASGVFTLTNGSIDLQSFTLSCTAFASSNTNARSIAFGTGRIVVTATSTTIWNCADATNLTVSGSPIVEATSTGTGTRTVTHGNTAGGGESNAISLHVTAGGGNLTASTHFKDFYLVGFSGTVTNTAKTFYGDVTFATTNTITATSNALTFASASATQVLTTAGKTIDIPCTKTGAGTIRLADAFSISGRTFTLTSGQLDINSQAMTCGILSSNNSNTRSINFGSGGVLNAILGGTAFNATTFSGMTISGTGTVSMNSASSKTFAGGGGIYSGVTLNQGGAGALTITGANTFANITNTVQPATITFQVNTTTTVGAFSVSGTSGNQITLNSSAAGTRATLSDASGVNSVSFCTIQDINATGGATWNSFTSNGNVDGGNNVGWDFFAQAFRYIYTRRKNKVIFQS